MTRGKWNESTLDDLGEVLIGLTYSPSQVGVTGDLVLRSSNIQNGALDLRDSVRVTADIPDKIRVKKSDILICVRNGSRSLIGKSILLDQRVEGETFGAFMAVFRSPLNDYLRFFFESSEFKRQVDGHLGATINQITNRSLKSFRVLVPPAADLAKVTEALADASELVHKLESLIAKKQAIKQGMMQQLLSGKTRLPGYAEPWQVMTLGAVGDVKTGPFGSALHESDYVLDGTPIITVEHLAERGVQSAGAPMVSDSDRRRLQAYALRAGDIVFSRVGSIDRNARVTETESGWLFSGRLLRVRFDPAAVDPRFMSAQFHSPKFTDAVRAVAVGQTMPSLNTGILKGIQIQLPPLGEQQAIGTVVEALDQELDVLERRAKSARDVKQGMMQELLTGRTRLNVAEPSV